MADVYALARCPHCGNWLRAYGQPGEFVVGCLHCHKWSKESKDVERAVASYKRMYSDK